MADFGFVGAAYPTASIYQDTQECINFLPEIDPALPEGSRNVIALYGTPGLELIAQLPNVDEVRGIRPISGGDQLLVVCGSLVYVLDKNFNTDYVVGKLNTGSGPVTITDNGQWAYIVDNSYRYVWRINTKTRANFLATFAGNVMTVTQIFSGTLAVGQEVIGVEVPPGILISALGTGTGLLGTYILDTATPVPGVQRVSTVTPTSVIANSYISGDRLFVTGGSQTGIIYLSQELLDFGALANTIITETAAQNVALTGTGDPSTTTATYTISDPQSAGTITGANRTAAGSGYTALPTIQIAGPLNGAGEQAIVTVNFLTAISFTISNAGTGYTVGDVYQAVGGVATIPATLTITTVGTNNAITGATLAGGSYTSAGAGNYVLYKAGSGAGTGATVTLSFGIGDVFTVVKPGSGYEQNPVIATVTGGGGSAAAVSLTLGGTPVKQTFYGFDFTALPSTDGAFSTGISVDVLDNIMFYAEGGSQRWGATDISNPISPQLSFTVKDGSPDDVIAVISNNREIFVLGERSLEIYVNNGSVPFPFTRLPGAANQQGCSATHSVARLGNTIAYLSRNSRGEGQIMHLNGYVPERISTHAMEYSIDNQFIEDAIAYTYQLRGHEIYVITFPSLDLTWAYDLNTGLWHKWMRWDPATGFHRRHRVTTAAQFNGKLVGGDFENGKLYLLDNEAYSDDGMPIVRLRRAPHLVEDYKQAYFTSLQIYFEPGVGNQALGRAPQAMMRWSSDGGSTWSNEYWQSVGNAGQYRARAIWRRMGRARDRIYELRVSDPVKWAIISAELIGEAGDH